MRNRRLKRDSDRDMHFSTSCPSLPPSLTTLRVNCNASHTTSHPSLIRHTMCSSLPPSLPPSLPRPSLPTLKVNCNASHTTSQPSRIRHTMCSAPPPREGGREGGRERGMEEGLSHTTKSGREGGKEGGDEPSAGVMVAATMPVLLLRPRFFNQRTPGEGGREGGREGRKACELMRRDLCFLPSLLPYLLPSLPPYLPWTRGPCHPHSPSAPAFDKNENTQGVHTETYPPSLPPSLPTSRRPQGHSILACRKHQLAVRMRTERVNRKIVGAT